MLMETAYVNYMYDIGEKVESKESNAWSPAS